MGISGLEMGCSYPAEQWCAAVAFKSLTCCDSVKGQKYPVTFESELEGEQYAGGPGFHLWGHRMFQVFLSVFVTKLMFLKRNCVSHYTSHFSQKIKKLLWKTWTTAQQLATVLHLLWWLFSFSGISSGPVPHLVFEWIRYIDDVGLCFAGLLLTTRCKDKELNWDKVEESRLSRLICLRACKVMCCYYEIEILGEVFAFCTQIGYIGNTV